MSDAHPLHYLVQAERNNLVVHVQEASNHEEALRMKERFESVPHTIATIIEVHEKAETDLTTKTREVVEAIAARGHSHPEPS